MAYLCWGQGWQCWILVVFWLFLGPRRWSFFWRGVVFGSPRTPGSPSSRRRVHDSPGARIRWARSLSRQASQPKTWVQDSRLNPNRNFFLLKLKNFENFLRINLFFSKWLFFWNGVLKTLFENSYLKKTTSNWLWWNYFSSFDRNFL